MTLLVQFRPVDAWPGTPTPSGQRYSASHFKATYQGTVDLLERELGFIRARDVVVQTAHRPQDIGVNGWPLARATSPASPGVILSFEARPVGAKEHMPLRYATDRFPKWEHNLRAIALSLEALRAVDRYGVTTSGEQYQGWARLEAPRAMPNGLPEGMDRDTAVRFLCEVTGWPEAAVTAVPNGPKSAYRAAARKLHPDAGGAPDDWKKLERAKELLGVD